MDAHAAWKVQQFATRLSRLARTANRGHGITSSQYSLMALLSAEPNTSVAELARREVVAHPTMSRLITTLEKANLVRRSPDPKDGRSSLVSLTKEGDQLYEEVATRRERLFELLLAQLSPTTIQDVLDLVDRSATSIEASLRESWSQDM